MQQTAAHAFAQTWAAACRSRHVGVAPARFADGVRFTSPAAAGTVADADDPIHRRAQSA